MPGWAEASSPHKRDGIPAHAGTQNEPNTTSVHRDTDHKLHPSCHLGRILKATYTARRPPATLLNCLK